jgi:sugar lactone lactonase YvrE
MPITKKHLLSNIIINFCYIIGLFSSPNISANASWAQNGITIAGGNGYGSELNQLSSPFGIDVDDDQTLYIADWFNHRIFEWKSGAISGQVVVGGNGSGKRADQLDRPTDIIVDKKSDCFIISDRGNRRIVRWPRRNGTHGQTIISNVNCWGLAMDNDGYLYVSDDSKHEVRRWRIGDTSGTVIAGGNEKGHRLDQLDCPTSMFVDRDYSLYVSDSQNHRVMKWMKGAKEGIVVAGGQDQGGSLTQLSNPEGVVVDQLGTVYVADQSNHRVMRWFKGAAEGGVILAGNGDGEQSNQLRNPVGLSFDRHGNLYVADMNNHRIQKFNIDSRSNS